MRKIALLMDGWKRFTTFAWQAGILQRIGETNEDASLYIFNSSGGWSRDDRFNAGEYNIYRLPDLSDFDGVILDLNNVRYPEVRDYVVGAAREAGRPVVSIANDIEDFYYAGIDNYSAMRDMIGHLYDVHGCRSFWFIMGQRDNYENQMRVRGMEDFLREKGLERDEGCFYYESFDFKCGMNGFEHLYAAHGQELPDAVLCASDNIAVGVCEAAARHGLSAPGDFRVTGFDNFDKAAYYSPSLTTIAHIREEVGYRSADVLLRLWAGEELPHFNYTGYECIFRESCGCAESAEADWQEHEAGQIIYGIETDGFEEQVLSLEYELMQCTSVGEMFRKIPKCLPSMNCDAMYLVVDSHINDFRRNEDYFDTQIMENGEFCTNGYPPRMDVEFIYEDGEVKNCEGMHISGLFPMFETDRGGTDFLFVPIHFKERTVGYFVIRNATYLMEKQYLFQVKNTLISAIENLHKKEKLMYMNQMLSDLYVKDAMTGLYNRIGYQKLACRLFDEKRARNENLLIAYFDMDRLKYINDKYGHVQGDRAIMTISGALMKAFPRDAIAMRMGGDEFLVIIESVDNEAYLGTVARIRREISDVAEKMGFPFELTISEGHVITDMASGRELDDYVREADGIMYAEKKAKGAVRG